MSLEAARKLDAADPLARYRDRLRLPDGLIYLDGNSLGPLPAAAPDHIAEVVERQWGRGLIGSWNAAGWIDWPQRIAARLAPLVGASPNELLICDSTSVNIFKLLGAALAARPGRKVILSQQHNFPTGLHIAQGIARISGAELRTAAGEGIEEALDECVAVLMLTEIDYRSGRRHNMKALTQAAHERGALVLWDLAHSAGALDVRLGESVADLAVGCGYKFLNGGPGAPAWLYVSQDIQTELNNPLSGWMGHAEPFAFTDDYRPAGNIRRFLSGTPSIIALAALECGLATFEGVDPALLQAKAGALGDYFIDAVETTCPDLELASPRDASQRGAHVVFGHDEAYAIVQALIARGIVGDYREPGLMRFGFAPLFNRFEEAWIAAQTISDILASGEWNQPRFLNRAAVT